MNEFLKNLNKIEFAVTLACTGRCKHCQNGEPARSAEHMDGDAAARAVREVCHQYAISSVMQGVGSLHVFPSSKERRSTGRQSDVLFLSR